MVSFLMAVLLLVAGFFVYGRITEKIFAPDGRETPAYVNQDGVDYIPMPLWKTYLIQLLNIAGTGPIFGALGGAAFGPIVYCWIVFGCIFAGAVHDYLCGMISMRNGGASVSEIAGKYLGNGMRQLMRVFSVVLLIMCGVVFTTGPADLLAMITPDSLNGTFWLCIITVYYLIAAFLPIDRVIGKIYPLFGLCLIIMTCGVSGSLLFSGNFTMPELWESFGNHHADGTPLWPFLFVTVACGAISGFHATQSPMMARCVRSEKEGRIVFYGAMISEGIIALVWAAAGVSCYDSSRALLDAGGGCSAVVYAICQSTMGKIGMTLAMIGVIICPISSGDTAYRSARLTVADWFGIDQADTKKRLLVTIPLLCAGTLITRLDYGIVWRYFSWSNQTLAMIILWAASVYLAQNHKNRAIAVVPAMFMSAVSSSYFLTAPECLGLLWNSLGIEKTIYVPAAGVIGILFAIALFLISLKKTSPMARR